MMAVMIILWPVNVHFYWMLNKDQDNVSASHSYISLELRQDNRGQQTHKLHMIIVSVCVSKRAAIIAFD